jgi:hypothetical protein
VAAAVGLGGPVNVTQREVDPRRHNAYLAVISAHAEPVGGAMLAMAAAAGKAARSAAPVDFSAAADAMEKVRDGASVFLDRLAGARSPDYLRGDDDQLQDALKLLVDGARRGNAAAAARDGAQLTAAAAEMDGALRVGLDFNAEHN